MPLLERNPLHVIAYENYHCRNMLRPDTIRRVKIAVINFSLDGAFRFNAMYKRVAFRYPLIPTDTHVYTSAPKLCTLSDCRMTGTKT